MRTLRAFLRLAYFAVFALVFIACVQVRFWLRGEDMHWALQFRQRWVRRYLLPVVGVRLRTEGCPPAAPCLLVGNHRSYLDPALVCTEVLGWLLSKAEVSQWPLIGRAIRLTGVLFVERQSASSRKDALAAIAAKLREGYPVILFPEGTTHAEPYTREFRPGAFHTAIGLGVPIVPMAVDYRNSDAYWIDDDTFLPHFLRCFGKPHTDAALYFGPPIRVSNADEAIAAARHWIDQALDNIRQNFSATP